MITDGDVNGDISGDESINSDHQDHHDDENSMDSNRGGALNLVSQIVKYFHPKRPSAIHFYLISFSF